MAIEILVLGLAVTLAAWDAVRRTFDPEAAGLKKRLDAQEQYLAAATETLNDYGKRVADLEQAERARNALGGLSKGPVRVR